MALYDSADLLRRCRDAAQLPADDESMDDAAWYRLLTSAQGRWFTTMAAIVPGALYGTPELLESTDGGRTYTFGTDADGRAIQPMGQVELYRTADDADQPSGAPGYALRPGVDFSVHGERVTLSPTSPIAFDDGGPWARYIEPPGEIDASSAPTLLPIAARELIVLSAVEAWARQGGLRDPSPYTGLADTYWRGASPGDVGLLGALRTQYFAQTAPAGRGAVRLSRFGSAGGRSAY